MAFTKFPIGKLPEMVTEYDGGNKTLQQVADKFKVSVNSMYRQFRIKGVDTKIDYKRNGDRIRQFHINVNYFKKIDSRDKAYIFGWVMSDGNMNDSGSCYQIRLKIADFDMLEKIKKAMGYERDLFVPKKESERHKQTKILIISNMEMFQDLINLGCTPRKSLTKKFPTSVPNELLPDFLRGYFDGNGSIYLFTQNLFYFLEIKICSSKSFSASLFSFLTSIGIKCQLDHDKRSHEGTGQVRIRSINDCVKFMEYIYKDLGDNMFLGRKRDKYLKFRKLRNL